MKRFLCFVLLFLLLFSVAISSSANEAKVAEDLTKNTTLQLISGSGAVSRLKDRSVTTACSTTG